MVKLKEQVALIAGGAGFIGSHIADTLLGDGWRVIVLDNMQTGRHRNIAHLSNDSRFELLEQIDISVPLPRRLYSTLKVDRIYNFACAASPPHYQANPEHTMLTNVVGTQQLLRLAESKRARFFLASTSEVYGDPEVHPQKEAYWGHVNPTGPRACYDEGKRAAETLTFDFVRARRVDARVIRIFNTYGPRMRADDGRVVSNVITQAIRGNDITVYGDGEQTRSFCYVDDLVTGIIRLMERARNPGGPINLGNPDELTVMELVQRVLSLTGSRSRISRRPLPIDDPQRRRPDVSRATALLHWSPKIDLDTGLRKTITYFAKEIELDVPREHATSHRAHMEQVPVLS